MKKAVVLYLHMHQPQRVGDYSVFDIGERSDYFSGRHDQNRHIFLKVAASSYRPMLSCLQESLQRQAGFSFTLSLTGTFLEQAETWAPDIISTLQELVATGRVELLGETYHHSLAFFYSRQEFEAQVRLHALKLQQLFDVTPTSLRHTELAYNDELAQWADRHGYAAILAEGWEPVLDGRGAGYSFYPEEASSLRVLTKNYRLSDDIAFRFSDRSWNRWPLSAASFASWVDADTGGPLVNLWMDFETFGEHQWADTGIFSFFGSFVDEWLHDPAHQFHTISGAATTTEPSGRLSVPKTLTWADSERDLSAWTGNSLQTEALSAVYALEKDITGSRDLSLIHDWRALQTSDHFYYMAMKQGADGDVHRYFSPYDSPFDAFIAYMNAVRDLRLRVMRYHRIGGLNV